jgi:hypothetical protein
MTSPNESTRNATSRATVHRTTGVLVFAALCAILGCSSSSSPAAQPCNENPWECPAGQTCWPTTGGAFQCLNSGQGTLGSPCQDSLGIPTCSDGFACLETSASGGECTPYCDSTNPAHGCPAGLACQTAELLVSGGAEFHVCAGGTLVINAGSDASVTPDANPTPDGSGAIVDAGASDAAAADTGSTILYDSGVSI